MSGDGRLADPGSLRRIELLALAWTAVGALGYGAARSWAGGLVLTAVSGVGIVLFRGLQRVVSALGPPGSGSDEPAGPPEGEPLDPAPADEPRTIGWRPVLGALVRFTLLAAIAGAGALLLDPEHFPAIVLGFSTLPAAFMTEGGLQVVRALRGRDHDDVS